MSSDPFLDQLTALCRDQPTRAKWVVVPTHRVGLTLGDRLVREGCDWANVRFVTPLDIAVRMAAPFLLEQGVDPSGEALGPPLIMRLLLERGTGSALSPDPGEYFRPMAEHTSMAQALWRTIRELRYAGVGARALGETSFTGDDAKRTELVGLLVVYERHLQTTRVADMPMVLEEALRHLAWCPIVAGDLVIELPDAIWSPLVRRFLNALPGGRVASRAPRLRGVPVPPRAAGPEVERVEVEEPDAGTLEIFHAGGRDAEMEEVFRRIIAAGRPLDQVEIACASDDYQWLAREKAVRFGWKVTVSAGVPAAMTAAGRLLLRYSDWIGSEFAGAELRRLLQSGDCRAIRVEKTEGPSGIGDEEDDDTCLPPGMAARLLLKAQATSGRATYERALTQLAQKYQRAAADLESSHEDRAWQARKGAQTRTLLAWVRNALALLPEPDASTGNTVLLPALVGAASAFLEANAARASAIDAVAHAALVDALGDLETLGAYRCPVPAALRFLRERVASLSVGAERPRPGHLHVSSLREAGFDGRRLALVVGLQEGGVFPPLVEDPVLLDGERRAVSPSLRTSIDQQDEAVFATLSRLAALGLAAERMCLSYSCFDTRDFRETFPSWVVLQAFRRKQRDPALTYDDLRRWLGDPVSAVPAAGDVAIGEAGWWLAQAGAPQLADAGSGQAGGAGGGTGAGSADSLVGPAARRSAGACRGAILAAYPSLARGIEAEAQRESDCFTEFDGYVPEAGAALDPLRGERAWSATALEGAAKCPLRFFMQQGLGVRAIEETRKDDDAWLDPATKGTELHNLFARAVRAIRDRRRTPDLKAARTQLLTWGRERLEELRRDLPPPSGEVFARESQEFLDDLEAFIDAESEGRHGAQPVGLEVSFGFPLDADEAETLARPEPIAIDLPGARRILLHGRIDRINRIAPGEYEVVDYKTGGYWADDWEGEFAGGTRLQHALYGVAATTLLRNTDAKARVVRGVYIFPAVRGHRRMKTIPSPSKAKLAGVLDDLAGVIASGGFVPADGEQACRWCDFKAACHAEDVNRAARKRENVANTVLEPYRRLRGDHA